MNYISRNIEQTISEAAKYFPVIAVTGPRQSGKSTLLGHLFPEAIKFSLKDVNIRSFAESDPVAFLNQIDKPLFINIYKVSWTITRTGNFCSLEVPISNL